MVKHNIVFTVCFEWLESDQSALHAVDFKHIHVYTHSQGWSYDQTLGSTFGVSSAILASVAFIFIRLIGKRESPITMVRLYFCV